ncbi:MAG: hypothetical protein V4489_04030 [Chlamydiota bacterium]
MKENRKKPQNKLPIQQTPNAVPQKEINKPLDKENYSDRKNPRGGCGCS